MTNITCIQKFNKLSKLFNKFYDYQVDINYLLNLIHYFLSFSDFNSIDEFKTQNWYWYIQQYS